MYSFRDCHDFILNFLLLKYRPERKHVKKECYLGYECRRDTILKLIYAENFSTWRRHQMEKFSALLALCAGNSPVTAEFPTQRPVKRSCDVFIDLSLNKPLRKQLWGCWFETPSRSLWRHCNKIHSRCPSLAIPACFQLKYACTILEYCITLASRMVILAPTHKQSFNSHQHALTHQYRRKQGENTNV